MSQRVVTVGLIVGSLVAAWLRFDAGSLLLGWGVVLACITGAAVAAILNARRLPSIQLPARVQDLAGRDELTPLEEGEFRDSLQEWHRRRQETAYREIARAGPVPQIRARGALYFLWLSLIVLAVLPRAAVPPAFLSQLPRFVIVMLPIALISVGVAVPLGIRDWRNARKALADGGS